MSLATTMTSTGLLSDEEKKKQQQHGLLDYVGPNALTPLEVSEQAQANMLTGPNGSLNPVAQMLSNIGQATGTTSPLQGFAQGLLTGGPMSAVMGAAVGNAVAMDPQNVSSINAQNGSDIGAHPGNGFGSSQGGHAAQIGNPAVLPLDTVQNSMTGGIIPSIVGIQAPAPVTNMDLNTSGSSVPGVTIGGPISSGNATGTDLGLLDSIGIGGGISAGDQAAIDAGGAHSEGMVDSGGGGGGDAKMICTELHRQGLMPREIFEADQAFGEILVRLHPETYDGYAAWARHVVRWMQRGDLAGRIVTKIAHAIATPWAHEMARRMGVPAKRTVAGWLLMEGGLRVCAAIGAARKTNQPRTA